jgi:hypothetical protein
MVVMMPALSFVIGSLLSKSFTGLFASGGIDFRIPAALFALPVLQRATDRAITYVRAIRNVYSHLVSFLGLGSGVAATFSQFVANQDGSFLP